MISKRQKISILIFIILSLVVGSVYIQRDKLTVIKGIIYLKIGMNDEAILEFSKAIEKSPNFLLAYSMRGMAYGKKRDNDRAISDLSKAIEINPNIPSFYGARGLAYYQKGDFDKAITDYDEAIQMNSNYATGNATVYSVRGMAYAAKGNYDKAWQDIHKAEALGYKVHPDFIEQLKKSSGRDK